MADIVVDGKTKVAFVPTIANPAAPTVAELTAGTELQTRLRSDGLKNFEPSTASVDNTSLASTFTTKLPGRPEFGDTALELKKQSGTDTVFDTLTTPGTNGYIVTRIGTPHDTAWAAADKVQVYPIQTGQWFYVGFGEANSVLRYQVTAPIVDQPALKAVVAS